MPILGLANGIGDVRLIREDDKNHSVDGGKHHPDAVTDLGLVNRILNDNPRYTSDRDTQLSGQAENMNYACDYMCILI